MKKVNVSAAGVLVSAMALSGAAVASPNAGFSQQEFRTALIEQDRIFKRTASVLPDPKGPFWLPDTCCSHNVTQGRVQELWQGSVDQR